MFAAAWWLSGTRDQLIAGLPRVSALLPAAGVILLFLLLNIEIADFYSTGPTIAFRFGDDRLAGSDLHDRLAGVRDAAAGRRHLREEPAGARITAVALIAVTTLKCFLYDLASLGGPLSRRVVRRAWRSRSRWSRWR